MMTLSENCSLLGTVNAHGQISEHIFAPNGGYGLFSLQADGWMDRNSVARGRISWRYIISLPHSQDSVLVSTRLPTYLFILLNITYKTRYSEQAQ